MKPLYNLPQRRFNELCRNNDTHFETGNLSKTYRSKDMVYLVRFIYTNTVLVINDKIVKFYGTMYIIYK